MPRIAGPAAAVIFSPSTDFAYFYFSTLELFSIFNDIHEAVNYSLMGIYTKLPTSLIKYSALDLIAAAIKSERMRNHKSSAPAIYVQPSVHFFLSTSRLFSVLETHSSSPALS